MRFFIYFVWYIDKIHHILNPASYPTWLALINVMIAIIRQHHRLVAAIRRGKAVKAHWCQDPWCEPETVGSSWILWWWLIPWPQNGWNLFCFPGFFSFPAHFFVGLGRSFQRKMIHSSSWIACHRSRRGCQVTPARSSRHEMAMFKNSQILHVQNFLTLQVCFQMQKHLENLQAYPFFPPLESTHLFL